MGLAQTDGLARLLVVPNNALCWLAGRLGIFGFHRHQPWAIVAASGLSQGAAPHLLPAACARPGATVGTVKGFKGGTTLRFKDPQRTSARKTDVQGHQEAGPYLSMETSPFSYGLQQEAQYDLYVWVVASSCKLRYNCLRRMLELD